MTQGGTKEFPVLIAETGQLDGNRWMLDSEVFVIGRSPGCDLVVPDRQVSRRHARIIKLEEGYALEDLHSKNGTHLNGQAVRGQVMLSDGDIIQIALAAKLIYVGTEATVPLSVNGAIQMGLGRLRMDQEAHRVWVGEEELDPPLSPSQYRLLSLLYEHGDRVVTRDEIVDQVWSEEEGEGVSEQAIDALIRRLRDRIAEVDPDHGYIVTVRGHGFRLSNRV